MTIDHSHEQPIAGVLAPLFALRSKEDPGCGNLRALREFIAWAAQCGFGCVQLLPVNETGGDHSPYNAVSSVAIEPTTIDMTVVPDLQPAEFTAIAEQHHAPELRQGPVRWRLAKALQRALLRRAFANFSERHWETNDERARAFAEFVNAEAAWLDGYAMFRVLMARHGGEHWESWPEEVRSLAAARTWLAGQRPGLRNEITLELRFVQYVQWLAFTQWRDTKRFATQHGVALMGDVPFGVNYHSADVWAEPELFDLRWSGGAPPEPAFTDDRFVCEWGQNWGVPLYRWATHRARNFSWWRQRVRKIAEGFHIFRIDHVLGFYRIYGFPWRPERNPEFAPLTKEEARQRTGGELPHYHEQADDTPAHKAANRARGEEFLRVLQNEVGVRALVGEDLGTVPDYVRPSLLSLEIPGFKVPQWEIEPDTSLTAAAEYTRCSVATFATHDHDPLRVMWEKWMAVIRAALDEPERLAAERDRTWREVRRLAAWAGFDVPRILDFEVVHEPLVAGLLRSNSWLVVLMITDVLGTAQRFNVPGTVDAANWSARLPDDWQEQHLAKIARVSALIHESGRGRGA
jgi:4-alpha-glucanotransferase